MIKQIIRREFHEAKSTLIRFLIITSILIATGLIVLHLLNLSLEFWKIVLASFIPLIIGLGFTAINIFCEWDKAGPKEKKP